MTDREPPRHVVACWTSRFPALSSGWTHWALYGDLAFLGLVAGNDLSRALSLVAASYDQRNRIYAVRSKLDWNGHVVEEKGYAATLWHYDRDTLLGAIDTAP